MNIIEKLKEPLGIDDVEVRVGSNYSTGFTMLLYKTARTDMKRLNDVCGLDWSNSHRVDTKGNITCEISIYNEKTNSWVSREDTGVESFTEKEKGSYSDSFKRAGFRWGIGIELYDAPLIWVKCDMKKNEKGRFEPIEIKQSAIKLSKYEFKNNQIYLELIHKGDIIFTNFKRYEV